MTQKKQETRESIFEYPPGFLDKALPKGALSPSSFNMYRRCPKQYYYSYVKEVEKKRNVPMFKGTVTHYGVEMIHRYTLEYQKRIDWEDIASLTSDKFNEDKAEVSSWGDTNKGHLKDTILNGLYVYYQTAVPLIKPVAVEKPFTIKVGGVPFRGIIDLVDDTPGDYVLHEEPPNNVHTVVDLKISTKKWIQQKVDYETQFTFYSIAEDTANVRVDFILDQKSGTKYVPVSSIRTKNEKRLLAEDASDTSDLIKRGVFPRCDPTNWNCSKRFCDYYTKCRGV